MNLRRCALSFALAAATALSLPAHADRPQNGQDRDDHDKQHHDRDHHDGKDRDHHDRDRDNHDRARDLHEHHDNGLHRCWYKHQDNDADEQRHDRDRDRDDDRDYNRYPDRGSNRGHQLPARTAPTDYRRSGHAGAYQDGYNQGRLDRMAGGSRPYNRQYADP